MGYCLEYKESFSEDLSRLDKKVHGAVLKKIRQIQENPLHFDFLHKAGRIQKARVGKWRILFRVEGNIITFYRVGNRDDAYRGMEEIMG